MNALVAQHALLNRSHRDPNGPYFLLSVILSDRSEAKEVEGPAVAFRTKEWDTMIPNHLASKDQERLPFRS